MSSTPRFEATEPCSECGQFGAYEFADELLCMDCYQQRGSCCAERESTMEECVEKNNQVARESPGA